MPESDSFSNTSGPVSFMPEPDSTPVHRRAAFSRSAFGLVNRHAVTGEPHQASRSRRRKVNDESLHLIDDLVNRPIDPLYEDSTLLPQNPSKVVFWATKILTFVFCVIVGISGCLIVQELHMNTRQKVREELAQQVVESTTRQRELESDVSEQRSRINELANAVRPDDASSQAATDAMANGTVAVTGPGVTVTLTDPIAATDQQGELPRDDEGQSIRVVSDTDLQMIVSRLWGAGAEAIAVNDVRLGVQSSIRTAGQTILVGVTSVQSPYRIQAIGDQDALMDIVGDQSDSLYASLEQVGIYPEISKTDTITLKAAASPELDYARGDN